MRNFQGTIFTLIRSNRDIFKSTLVYLESNKLNQWQKKNKYHDWFKCYLNNPKHFISYGEIKAT